MEDKTIQYDMSDEYDEVQPIESHLFYAMVSSLKRGLDAYCERERKEILFDFRDTLNESLDSFASGNEGANFDFSIALQSESNLTYVDFRFEESLLEVSSGGMVIDRSVGSDSYTDWIYSIWNDGSEDADNITEDVFDIIQEMLENPNVRFSISTPDELAYNSEPDEDENEKWDENFNEDNDTSEQLTIPVSENEENPFAIYYPLEEHYFFTEHYLRSRFDWDAISKEIKQNGVAVLCVSDVIKRFPHLELDENYNLICYLGREYHGIWGRIAAIMDGADVEPVLNLNGKKYLFGSDFKLPESACPPMEAIYHDGTDEGFFEAVLCSFLLDAIPYMQFIYRHLNIAMDSTPPNFQEEWDIVISIDDWMPRRVGNSIIAFKRKVEDGLHSSDGRDRIYLTQFNFKKDLGLYHALNSKEHRSMYRNQIDDDKRYTENRHCCVFTESSVLIAEERQGKVYF